MNIDYTATAHPMFRSANVLGYKSHILYIISSEFTTIVVGGSWAFIRVPSPK